MRGRGDSRSACGASSEDSVPIVDYDFGLGFARLLSRAAFASRVRSATSASRLCTSSLRGRRPFGDPTAYSQKSGNAIVESQ